MIDSHGFHPDPTVIPLLESNNAAIECLHGRRNGLITPFGTSIIQNAHSRVLGGFTNAYQNDFMCFSIKQNLMALISRRVDSYF